MIELRHFLTSLYDSVSEAEVQALVNGRERLRRMVDSGEFPDDASLPVYHATNLSVTLDVGLKAERTKQGIQVFVTEPSSDEYTERGDNNTELRFELEVYDFLQANDFASVDADREGAKERSEDGLDVHIPLRAPPFQELLLEEGSRHYRGRDRSELGEADDETTNNEQTDNDTNDRGETSDDGGDSNHDNGGTGDKDSGTDPK